MTRGRFAWAYFHLLDAFVILFHRHTYGSDGYWRYPYTTRLEDDVFVKPTCDICGAVKDHAVPTARPALQSKPTGAWNTRRNVSPEQLEGLMDVLTRATDLGMKTVSHNGVRYDWQPFVDIGEGKA